MTAGKAGEKAMKLHLTFAGGGLCGKRVPRAYKPAAFATPRVGHVTCASCKDALSRFHPTIDIMEALKVALARKGA